MDESIVICAEESGDRVDALLARHIDELSRSAVQRLLDEGRVLLRGEPVKKNYRCAAGDRFFVELPEAEDVEVEIRQEDIRIDTYRASGHGGQYINRTDSAVRITHLPSGLVVTCQDEKSQLKNKEKAMKVLKSRLYDLYRAEKDAAYAENRRSQVGSGERNERIRTYNFPQGRVTDHRAGITLYKIDAVVDGDLDEIIDALTLQEQAEKLRQLGQG